MATMDAILSGENSTLDTGLDCGLECELDCDLRRTSASKLKAKLFSEVTRLLELVGVGSLAPFFVAMSFRGQRDRGDHTPRATDL